nr:hypothetical protein [uncultured Campylobacter sp.]
MLTISVIILLISFVLNLKGIKQDLVAIFYSPQTRFWELLSGAVLAWLNIHKNNTTKNFKLRIDHYFSKIIYRESIPNDGRSLSNVYAFMGIFILIYGFLHISKTMPFPGKWAIIPILGSIFIIIAGSNGGGLYQPKDIIK